MINLSHVDNGKAFDWGLASEHYAKYRDIYPDAFFDRFVDLGVGVNGQYVLDLGTGTGVIPRGLYKYGARWIGADIAENQIAHARRIAAESGMAIEFIVVPAERTGLPDDTFDAITACQCFVYFDKPVVLPEIQRMLKRGGCFVSSHMMWLPYESDIVAHSESLILKYNPAWTGGGYMRTPPKDFSWCEPWFDLPELIQFDVNIPFTRESWQGRMLACRGIGASSLPPDVIAAFCDEHAAYVNTLPESFEIPHHVGIDVYRVKK